MFRSYLNQQTSFFRYLKLLIFTSFSISPLFGFSQVDTTSVSRTLPIEEVVVLGAKSASTLRPSVHTSTVIPSQVLEQSMRSSLLPTLSEEVPGLFVTARGVMGYGVSGGAAGGMSLRGIGGSPTTGLLVVIDGQPQYSGLMGHPVADSYLTANAEQVEVVRGPASVLYGSNAMGGVIHITTRNRQQEGGGVRLRSGYGSYNSWENQLQGDLHRGPVDFAIGGLYNRTDGHRPDMAFEQYGASLRLGVTLSRAWKVAITGDLTHFNASNPGTLSAPLIDNDSRITRARAALSLEHRYERLSGALTLAYNRGRHRINDGYGVGEEPLDYRFQSHDDLLGASFYESFQLATGSRLILGMDYLRLGGEASNRFVNDGHTEPIADLQADEVATYLDFRQRLTRHLSLDCGVRLDYHSRVGSEWIPRVALTCQLSRQSTLEALVSKGFRYPTLREMFLFPSQNPDLEAEQLWNYELSFSHRHSRFGCGVNLFYLEGKNRIETVMVEGRPRNQNSGKIENWGAEGELSLAVGRLWNISANYSYLNMRYPVLAAPEHKLFFSVAFQKGRWRLQSGVQYIAGLYTELATTTDRASTEEFVLWNLRGSVRLAKWINLWMRGENLLAQHYEINAGFPMPGATVMGGVEIGF